MRIVNAYFVGKRYVYPGGKPCLVESLDASQFELTATSEGLLAREPGADSGVVIPWHWVQGLNVDGLNAVSTEVENPAPAGPVVASTWVVPVEMASAKTVPLTSTSPPVGGKRGGARR